MLTRTPEPTSTRAQAHRSEGAAPGSTMPAVSRYAATKQRVRDHAAAHGYRMSRNSIERAAKYVMAAEDGAFFDVGPSPLTYRDDTGERATGRGSIGVHEFVAELIR